MRALSGQISPGAVTPALVFGSHVIRPHGDQRGSCFGPPGLY